ncbi:pyridoxal-phosphate dependent enzyme [Amycolatopsis bartoniae]|uniref:pyridoxal-phosphate dependent enzyme n=1 Tax=Amycolatopsis bartoniae TaxID=941986 RepID=UPI001605FF11
MTTRRFGLERFANRLPSVSEFVTLGEGNTPVVPLPRLARGIGLGDLSAKLETANPTGSYKDRAAAMSISLALSRGCPGWIATSSGNAGAAFAAYAARAGLPGMLCVVAGAPPEKLAALLPYGTSVMAVEGIGTRGSRKALDRLLRQVSEFANERGLFLGVTANALNPDGMRGVDTIGYELAEQLPDATHVYLPVGGGGLLVSVARGLSEYAMEPVIVASQPAGCAPVARYLSGEIAVPRVDRCSTVVSGLQLPSPPDGCEAAKAVEESGGWGTTVTDEEVVAAQELLVVTEGLFVEPASATVVAALIRDVRNRRVNERDHPVLLLTGAGWKDLSRFAARTRELPRENASHIYRHLCAWFEKPKYCDDKIL